MKYIVEQYYTIQKKTAMKRCEDILEIYFNNTDSTFNFADMAI